MFLNLLFFYLIPSFNLCLICLNLKKISDTGFFRLYGNPVMCCAHHLLWFPITFENKSVFDNKNPRLFSKLNLKKKLTRKVDTFLL